MELKVWEAKVSMDGEVTGSHWWTFYCLAQSSNPQSPQSPYHEVHTNITNALKHSHYIRIVFDC